MAKRYSKRALEEAKKIPGFMWNNVKRSARVGRDIVHAINAFDRGAGSDPVHMPAGPQTPPPVAMPSYLGPEAADANRMAAYKRMKDKGMDIPPDARSAAINANSRNFNRAAATERYNSKYGPGGSRTTPLDEGMMTPFLGEVKKRVGDLGRTAKGVYDQTVDYWSGNKQLQDIAGPKTDQVVDYWSNGEGRDALNEVPGVIKGAVDYWGDKMGQAGQASASMPATPAPAAHPTPTRGIFLGGEQWKPGDSTRGPDPTTPGQNGFFAQGPRGIMTDIPESERTPQQNAAMEAARGERDASYAARDARADAASQKWKDAGMGSYLGPTAAGAARVADFRARATEGARSQGMQERFDRQAALGEREKDRGLARDVAGAQTEADIAKFTSGERAAVIKMQGDFAMADARGKNDMRTAVFKSVMESTADVNKAFEAVNQLEQQDAAAGGAGGAQGGGTTTPTSTDMNGDGVPDTLEEQATYAEQKAAQIQKTLLAGSYNGVALTPDQRKTLQTELAIAQKAARYRPTKGA